MADVEPARLRAIMNNRLIFINRLMCRLFLSKNYTSLFQIKIIVTLKFEESQGQEP
jgi:hypothetical protein